MKIFKRAALLIPILAALLLSFPQRAWAAEELTLSKYALELVLGESEPVAASGEVVWSSGDEKIATVSAGGVIRAVGVGETVVRAAGEGGSASVRVIVVRQKRSLDDNILLSVFWPPTAEYLNGGEGDERWEEQFELLKDAQIDWICNVTGRDRQSEQDPSLIGENSKETNLKMAEYAYRYGMRMTVADTRFGDNFLSLDGYEIENIISEYRNVPGVGGYYLKDEPFDVMSYIDAYESIKTADPRGYVHLNFLPVTYYMAQYKDTAKAVERYQRDIEDWLTASEERGYPQEYAMFDLYPFLENGAFEWDIYYSNLNMMRRIALGHSVKTAVYLQSVSSVGNFRVPSASEIRFNAMLALSFGYKQLSYFTWFLPTHREETFVGSVVGEDGVPNPETYEAICDLNGEIHTLGRTLARLDAQRVYTSGCTHGDVEIVPDGFPILPTGGEELTLSLLTDRQTGRNYCMVVNNDYSQAVAPVLSAAGEAGALRRVSPETGEEEPVPLSADGTFTLSLAAGDGALFALAEGYDYLNEYETYAEGAEELLSRAERERASLGGEEQRRLDGLVKELKDALAGTHSTQDRIDALMREIGDLLDRKEGCGSVLGGGAALLLLAAGILLLPARKRKK